MGRDGSIDIRWTMPMQTVRFRIVPKMGTVADDDALARILFAARLSNRSVDATTDLNCWCQSRTGRQGEDPSATPLWLLVNPS